MKFHLAMKTADAFDETINDLVHEGKSPADIAIAKKMLEAVLEYGEYLTVEFDTFDDSIKVMPVIKSYPHNDIF